MEERTVLGMDLEGDVIRRDVLQVSVSFLGHRYLGSAATEADSRWELKKRAFDFLVGTALTRLAEAKERRVDLDRQRHLLRRKLAALTAGNFGLHGLFDDASGDPPDLASLETEIAAIEAELAQRGGQALGLEQSLECVADTLSRPGDWLDLREICLSLDYRGIKVSEPTAGNPQELRLTELCSGAGARRIVLFGRVPRGEIPERPDFLKQAGRYLI